MILCNVGERSLSINILLYWSGAWDEHSCDRCWSLNKEGPGGARQTSCWCAPWRSVDGSCRLLLVRASSRPLLELFPSHRASTAAPLLSTSVRRPGTYPHSPHNSPEHSLSSGPPPEALLSGYSRPERWTRPFRTPPCSTSSPPPYSSILYLISQIVFIYYIYIHASINL